MESSRFSTDELLSIIKNAAFEVRRHLAPGYLEAVYRKALCVELISQGLEVKTEHPLNVFYKGNLIGEFRADIIVEDRVVIELKAVNNTTIAHELQLVNYLTATGIDDGFLINFGSEQYRIIHKTRIYQPRNQK